MTIQKDVRAAMIARQVRNASQGRFFAEVCQWFTLCTNEATLKRKHPILGEVHICKRCNDKMEALKD